jgi:hypothetical protein
MELYVQLARACGAATLLVLIACIAQGGPPPGGRDSAECATQRPALRTMLDAEYAFGEKALTSVRGAFLEYLDRDSWVLNPGPLPGRALYEASKDSKEMHNFRSAESVRPVHISILMPSPATGSRRRRADRTIQRLRTLWASSPAANNNLLTLM